MSFIIILYIYLLIYLFVVVVVAAAGGRRRPVYDCECLCHYGVCVCMSVCEYINMCVCVHAFACVCLRECARAVRSRAREYIYISLANLELLTTTGASPSTVITSSLSSHRLPLVGAHQPPPPASHHSFRLSAPGSSSSSSSKNDAMLES